MSLWWTQLITDMCLQVISLNFHPFYDNEEEICRKDEFHTNYSIVTFREDILTTRREQLRKVFISMLC